MLEEEKITDFINFNYVPFSKRNFINRLVFIWFMSVACIFFQFSIPILCVIFTVCIVLTVLFSVLMIKYSESKITRFASDGLMCLFVSVILNIIAYQILALVFGDNIIILMCFISALVISILCTFVMVIRNIKKGRYKEGKGSIIPFAFSMLFGCCGMACAKFFLKDMQQNDAIILLSVIMFLLSLLVSIGTTNLLKAFFLRWK